MHDDALELETRRNIYEFVRRYPGVHMRAIHRQLAMPLSLVEYHLNFMEEAGVLQALEEGGYKRYYAPSQPTGPEIGYQERRMLGLLRQAVPLQITLYLLNHGQTAHAELADRLGISPSRLSYHLKKMVKAGIVEKLTRADGRGYAVPEEKRILRLLMTHRPHPDMLDEFSELWDSLDLLAVGVKKSS